MEKLYVEDLAAMERLSDETILDEIKNRFKNGKTYSFIGDILLSLNPSQSYPIYDQKVEIFFWISENYWQKIDFFSSTIATCSSRDLTMLHIFSL